MAITDNTKLEILHDHYKESFSYIREREKQRDRLFLIIIAIVGILFLEAYYSDILRSVMGNINIKSTTVNLTGVPMFIFLSITWTYLFVVVLRYCQASINIERQYSYLHRLEDKISTLFEDKDVYCREGKAYLDKYPLFSELVWIFYTILFPIIIILSIGLIIYLEWKKIEAPYYHLIYDVIIMLGVMASFVLYRILPLIQKIVLKSLKK